MSISMSELAAYEQSLQKMKGSIEEYTVDNGSLVSDFPVFKGRIMECLDEMERIYEENKDDLE